MSKLSAKIQQFINDDSGPTAVEYAVMLALIIMACFAAISSLGSATNTVFSNNELKTTLSRQP